MLASMSVLLGSTLAFSHGAIPCMHLSTSVQCTLLAPPLMPSLPSLIAVLSVVAPSGSGSSGSSVFYIEIKHTLSGLITESLH